MLFIFLNLDFLSICWYDFLHSWCVTNFTSTIVNPKCICCYLWFQSDISRHTVMIEKPPHYKIMMKQIEFQRIKSRMSLKMRSPGGVEGFHPAVEPGGAMKPTSLIIVLVYWIRSYSLNIEGDGHPTYRSSPVLGHWDTMYKHFKHVLHK